jgi:small membrane protein
MIFQVLAITLLILIVLFDSLRVYKQSGNWLGYILRTLIWLSACLFILFPDTLTYFANRLGIGRGADVLLYLLTLAFIAVSFLLYTRVVQLQRQITQVVRHLALAQPLPPSASPRQDSAPCSSPHS